MKSLIFTLLFVCSICHSQPYITKQQYKSRDSITKYEINDLNLQFFNDALWFFYKINDVVYFNYEIKGLRDNKFHWKIDTHYFGRVTPYDFGYDFLIDKVSSLSLQFSRNVNELIMFYQPKGEYGIKYITHDIDKMDREADKKNWSNGSYVIDKENRIIQTSYNYSVVEYNFKTYLFYIDKVVKQLNIFDYNNKISYPVQHSITIKNRFGVKARVINDENGIKFILLLLDDLNQLNILVLDESFKTLYTSKIDVETEEMDFANIQTQIDGRSYLLTSIRGMQEKEHITIGEKRAYTYGINYLDDLLQNQFSKVNESIRFSYIQVPLNCAKSQCDLMNIYYPIKLNTYNSMDFNNILHYEKVGIVRLEKLKHIPIEIPKKELIGIIEGPPPVPLENILSRFDKGSVEYLPNVVYTSVKSILRTIDRYSETNSKQIGFSSSIAGNLGPVGISLESSLSINNSETNSTEKASDLQIEKVNAMIGTYNEGIKLIPLGKLILLEYDIIGYYYKFLDNNGSEIESAPKIYKFYKTDESYTAIDYHIIGKNSFKIGDIYSYDNDIRRSDLLDRATPLIENKKYLRFHYSQYIDCKPNINFYTKQTFEQSMKQDIRFKGSAGAKIFGKVDIGLSFEYLDTRIVSFENSKSKGMGIDADINFSIDPNNKDAKKYNFEVYYIGPDGNRNLKDLLEELEETKGLSKLNKKALEQIHPNSKPWKITYTASNIEANDGNIVETCE